MDMKVKMDFYLLKKPDPTTLQKGTKLVTNAGTVGEYVAGPDVDGFYVVLSGTGRLMATKPVALAPLAWLEGKPIYPGDVLWWRLLGEWKTHIAHHLYDDIEGWIADSNNLWLGVEALHWEKPKAKQEAWAVFVPDAGAGGCVNADGIRALTYPYKSEDVARRHNPNALAIVKVEWEA